MEIINLLGWIGNIGFVLGAIYLAKKKVIFCLYGNAIGNIAYIMVGFMSNLQSLWVLSIGLLMLDIYGFYKWRKE